MKLNLTKPGFVVGLVAMGSAVLVVISASLQAPGPKAPTVTQASVTKVAEPPAEPPKPALELIKAEAASEPYARTIVGKVRNNSLRSYSYVQATFNLFDKEGNRVGSAFANVNDLAPGSVWRFRAQIWEERATNWSFQGLSGF